MRWRKFNMNHYFFGSGRYEDVLTCLATTKVNSYRTSSLPLAQFWDPVKTSKELNKFLEDFKEKGIDACSGNRYFEYPTPCEDKNKKLLKYSQPSMTDLMIINDKYQIAIEGKYTEYSESNYETIREWNKNKEEHKDAIKNQWIEYIRECGATDKQDISDDIPYQFLHRTASACYNCKNSKKIPVLVYQLFYDSSNKKKKDDFINTLKDCARQLGFTDKIKFFIIDVKIENIDTVKEKYDGVRSDLFLIMKESKKPIYTFDWNNITISEIK